MSLGPDELPPLDPAKVVSDRRWSDWRGTPKRPEQSESSVSSDRLSEVVLTDTVQKKIPPQSSNRVTEF